MILASILLAVSVTVSPSHMGTVTATNFVPVIDAHFSDEREWVETNDFDFGMLYGTAYAYGDSSRTNLSVNLETASSEYDVFVVSDSRCVRSMRLVYDFPADENHAQVHREIERSPYDYPSHLPFDTILGEHSEGPAEYHYPFITNVVVSWGVTEKRVMTNVMHGTFRYDDERDDFTIKMRGTRPSKVVFSFIFYRNVNPGGAPYGCDLSISNTPPASYVLRKRKLSDYDVFDYEFTGLDGEVASADFRMLPSPFAFLPYGRIKYRYVPYGFAKWFHKIAKSENLLVASRAFERRDGGANVVTNEYTATYRQAFGFPISSGDKIVRATFRQHTNDVVGVVVDF